MVVWDSPSPITFSDVYVQGWHVIVLTLGLKRDSFVIVSECINPSCLDLKIEDGAITEHLEVIFKEFSAHFFPPFLVKIFVRIELELHRAWIDDFV